jgi:type II secretory pathway component GspD/PulD (secretin)
MANNTGGNWVHGGNRMKRILVSLIIACFLAGIIQDLYASQDEKKTVSGMQLVSKRLSYLKVNTAIHLVKPFLSANGKITAVQERNTLIIQDIPRVVEKILSIIDSIDVKPIDLQFTIDLISGSRLLDSKGDTDKELSADPLIKEILELLNYNYFKNLGTTIIKVRDNSESSHMIGKGLQLEIAPQLTREGDILVELRLTHRSGSNTERREINTILFQTKLAIKNKKRTVVGVSKFDDGDNKALIVLITGTIIK